MAPGSFHVALKLFGTTLPPPLISRYPLPGCSLSLCHRRATLLSFKRPDGKGVGPLQEGGGVLLGRPSQQCCLRQVFGATASGIHCLLSFHQGVGPEDEPKLLHQDPQLIRLDNQWASCALSGPGRSTHPCDASWRDCHQRHQPHTLWLWPLLCSRGQGAAVGSPEVPFYWETFWGSPGCHHVSRHWSNRQPGQ